MRLILCSILIFSHILSHGRQMEPKQFLLKEKLEGKYAGFVYLNYLPGVVFDEKNYSREFYLEPGVMTVTVSLSRFADMQVTGSPIDSENVSLMKLRRPYFNDERKLDQWDSLYIVQHPGSYMAADFLAGRSYSRIAFPSLEDLYNKLPLRIRQSDPGETIAFKIEQEKHLRTGIAAYDFSAPTDKGDTIRLKDFKRKKYVLLDFWASWCVPCRAWSPYLKRIKDKYSKDLEIISISIEKDRDPG
ncbi:MAG TPA: TlpA disulfide reductase family protein [Puia sp.]|nr:TlpA disulfide reductase family protein [Puia sp.]